VAKVAHLDRKLTRKFLIGRVVSRLKINKLGSKLWFVFLVFGHFRIQVWWSFRLPCVGDGSRTMVPQVKILTNLLFAYSKLAQGYHSLFMTLNWWILNQLHLEFSGWRLSCCDEGMQMLAADILIGLVRCICIRNSAGQFVVILMRCDDLRHSVSNLKLFIF
jgi:hypothetical protein